MQGRHHLGPFATAQLTRLVELDRTSPMANTPRRLVSSGRRTPRAGLLVSLPR